VRLTSPTRNQSPTRAPPEGRVGQPLSTLLGTPRELGEFLRVAAGIAKAVGGLHQRGVIHKHLQPSNILVDTVTSEAWLTGLDPSRATAEAFPYMAPEQSGRMSRSVDARSDLYSLGVILYEMLTGSLPFQASDPLEWIHSTTHPDPGRPPATTDCQPIVSRMLGRNSRSPCRRSDDGKYWGTITGGAS
jgi:serine/threonine protein kinase